MANSLFQALGGKMPGQTNALPGPFGNVMQLMQQFNQFCQTFQGDPKAEVERLVQSGKISQEQFQQVQQMARQIAGFMK